MCGPVWHDRDVFATFAEEWDRDLRSGDPLGFPGYAQRLADLDHESVRTGLVDDPDGCGRYVLIEGDFEVFGGSMGVVHGEKVVRAFDRATETGLPVVVVTRSGGARMQEGMVSLIQMARTAAAIGRHGAAGLLSIAVHRSPTTGGVFASYGSLADVRAVVEGATIGFAGPRVVEQTTGEDVTGRSHSSATASEAGLVDVVLADDDVAAWVAGALGIADRPLRVHRPPTPVRPASSDASGAWAEVLRARAFGRPTGIHFAADATTSWTELGEAVDPSLRVAIATIGSRRVVVLATDRYAGSGRPGPAGFRLAQRGIALAGRMGWPVVSFVDTAGAEPGSDAENDAVAGEIARTFAAMADVATPTVSACVGEGGSGGALALAASDVMLVSEHAIFSVIGPEGAAAILERDAAKAPEVAEHLRLTSADLIALGIVDHVVGDTLGAMTEAVVSALDDLSGRGSGAEGRGRRSRFDAASARGLA